jgi:hypothetical protein
MVGGVPETDISVINVDDVRATVAQLTAQGIATDAPSSPDGSDDFWTAMITDPAQTSRTTDPTNTAAREEDAQRGRSRSCAPLGLPARIPMPARESGMSVASDRMGSRVDGDNSEVPCGPNRQ